MTILLIKPKVKTLRALKETCNNAPDSLWFEDPAIVNPKNGGAPFGLKAFLPNETLLICMDHPVRRRFALIKRHAGNRFTVE